MTDIVERLRTLSLYLPDQRSAFVEAADEIEEERRDKASLQEQIALHRQARISAEAEIKRLRKALKFYGACEIDSGRVARAALS